MPGEGKRGRPRGSAGQRPPQGIGDLLAAVTGESVLPPLEDDDGSASARLTQTQPRLIEWLRWPIEDRAYQLYLRGYSMRQIGRELGCDKDSANNYVKQARREMAAWRRAKREEWLDETIERLRNVQRQAWTRWDECGDPMLLNTITRVEVEIAKLRGLYEVIDSATGAGVTISITHRGPQATIEGSVVKPDDDVMAAVDAAIDEVTDGDDGER